MKRQQTIIAIFALFIFALTANAQMQYRKALDFDGDGKADPTVVRNTASQTNFAAHWFTLQSTNGQLRATSFGLDIDTKLTGDFDGDGKADIATMRRDESGGYNWYILHSSNNTFRAVLWGTAASPLGDRIAPADYDGDGKTDIAVSRRDDEPGSSTVPLNLYILKSSNNQMMTKSFPKYTASNCREVGGDYDGDGKADFTRICSQGTNMVWDTMRSSDNVRQRISWGLFNGDTETPGDYDGDGKTDLAVVRRRADGGVGQFSLDWYIRLSSTGELKAVTWGKDNNVQNPSNTIDFTVPADYDGDGKTDIAVWRTSPSPTIGSTYYILQSQSNSLRSIGWGVGADSPMQNHYRNHGTP